MTGKRPLGVFIGATTLDLHYLVSGFPRPGSKGPAEAFGAYAGGPATNAAVTFAHLGGGARLCTEIGSHPLGGIAAAELRERGVEVIDLIEGVAAQPMVSAVLTTAGTGERTVIASHYPDAGLSQGSIGPLPSGTACLLVDGFLREACLDAARQASAAGIPVVLDAGSWKPAMEDLLPLVDVAVCSADFRPPGTSSHAEVLRHLSRAGIASAAISRGGAPILFSEGAREGTIPVAPVEVADTLGAGDILHGALCYHLASGRSFVPALQAAARVATASVRTFGTRAWMDR